VRRARGGKITSLPGTSRRPTRGQGQSPRTAGGASAERRRVVALSGAEQVAIGSQRRGDSQARTPAGPCLLEPWNAWISTTSATTTASSGCRGHCGSKAGGTLQRVILSSQRSCAHAGHVTPCHKTRGLSPPMCAMLTPGNAMLACAPWQRSFVSRQRGRMRRHAFPRGG